MTRIIATDWDLAKTHGLNAAAIHQQIGWAIKHRESFDETALGHEWLRASLAELARIIPLTVMQIRKALDVLEEADLVERRHVVERGLGQTSNEYRIRAFKNPEPPLAPEGRGPLPHRAPPLAPEGRPISNRRVSGPQGGIQCTSGGQVAEGREMLFGPEGSEPSQKSPDDRFEEWWGVGRQPGLYPAKAGSASAARSRFKKTLKAKSWDYIERCTRNYVAAVTMFELEHGVRPPILHGSTFLNADFRLDDWSEPWSPEQAAEFWSAVIPRSSNGRNSEIDVDAYIRAEEAARHG